MKKIIQFFLYRKERAINSYSETNSVNRVMGIGLNDIDDIVKSCKFDDSDVVYLKLQSSVEINEIYTMLCNLGERLKKLRIVSSYSYELLVAPEENISFKYTVDGYNKIVEGRFLLSFIPNQIVESHEGGGKVESYL